MPANFNLRDALRALRSEDSAPLLTDSEILDAIRKSKLNTNQQSNKIASKQNVPSRRAYQWTFGVAAVCAVSLVIYSVLDHDSASEKNLVESDTQLLTSEPTSNNETGMSAVPHNATINNESVQPETDNVSSSHESSEVLFIAPSKQTLNQLGIVFDEKKLQYQEGSFRITVTTSGVSVMNAPNRQQQKTPRHITLFRNKKQFASWFTAGTTPVNNLVPLRVTLADPSNTMFPSADVVLWYSPTEDFLAALPEKDRRTAIESQHDRTTTIKTDQNNLTPTISQSTVFPNPVHGTSATVALHVSQACTTHAEIVDLFGKTVMVLWTNRELPKGESSFPLSDLGTLPNGMYIVVIRVNGSNEQIVQRILIER